MSATSSAPRGSLKFNYQLRRRSRGQLVDTFFFIAASVLTALFAWHLIGLPRDLRWLALALIPFWAMVAYLVLPRLHQLMTSLYVPDYFLGRSRTTDGVLGDPVNLAFNGTAAQLHHALTAAGWTLADPVTLRSSWRIVVASLLKRSYPEAPVSPLFLFSRKQDMAYQQEVEGNPAQRHHMRVWRCPDGWPLPGGRRVDWLGSGTFDTSVGISFFTLQVTHRIHQDIDVERDYIVDTLTAAEGIDVEVDVMRDFFTSYHHRNGGGDLIRTDGNLPVVDVRKVEDSLADAPAQVQRAAPGFTTLEGYEAAPDPGAAALDYESSREAIYASPNSLRLALGLLLVSFVGQAAIVIRAIASGDYLPVAIYGEDRLLIPEADRQLVIASMVVFLCLTVILATLTLLGRRLPRVLLMALLCVSVAAHLTVGQDIAGTALLIHLLITCTSLLALLSLSSRSVRMWNELVRA